MKYLCPVCLLVERDHLVAQGQSTLQIDKAMSLVCNAAPVAPQYGDPCCCGAEWIPDTLVEG